MVTTPVWKKSLISTAKWFQPDDLVRVECDPNGGHERQRDEGRDDDCYRDEQGADDCGDDAAAKEVVGELSSLVALRSRSWSRVQSSPV